MIYQKPKKIKKKKTHKDSILHSKDGTCYLCMKLYGLYCEYRIVHEHHVYPGKPNRQISEANGFKVYLCPGHHEFTKEAVHENHEYMMLIKTDCQRKYEETHTRQQFMDLVGKNFLDEEESKKETYHEEMQVAAVDGFWFIEE